MYDIEIAARIFVARKKAARNSARQFSRQDTRISRQDIVADCGISFPDALRYIANRLRKNMQRACTIFTITIFLFTISKMCCADDARNRAESAIDSTFHATDLVQKWSENIVVFDQMGEFEKIPALYEGVISEINSLVSRSIIVLWNHCQNGGAYNFLIEYGVDSPSESKRENRDCKLSDSIEITGSYSVNFQDGRLWVFYDERTRKTLSAKCQINMPEMPPSQKKIE